MLIVSIALEAAVAILAVLAARRGKPYIYGLAFTFGAYVLYDLARLLHWNVQAGILSWLFLLATIRLIGGHRRHARILVGSARARYCPPPIRR